MKNCELCQLPARTFCESDQATLCWDCDYKVHGANFLVARHSRTLLCNACHAPTPWKASGEKLGHTFSVCELCVDRSESRGGGDDDDEESQAGNDDEIDTEEEEDEDDDEDDYDGDIDFDEDGDNQVVPWASSTPPPPSASSSSSEDEVNNGGRSYGSRSSYAAASLKRSTDIDNASDLCCQEEFRILSARLRCETACTAYSGRSRIDGGGAPVDSRRFLKDERLDLNRPISTAAVESPKRNLRRKLNQGSDSAVNLDPSKPRISPI